MMQELLSTASELDLTLFPSVCCWMLIKKCSNLRHLVVWNAAKPSSVKRVRKLLPNLESIEIRLFGQICLSVQRLLLEQTAPFMLRGYCDVVEIRCCVQVLALRYHSAV